MMRKCLLLVVLTIIILSGCAAISNEGKVDFRRTDGSQATAVNKLQEFKAKNFSLGKDSAFRKGDSLSLHLRTAYIRDFSESTVVPYITKAFSRQWGKVNGEIAIVANAFEEENGKELSFENMREGRVVFYSEDVHLGQTLNFNNMPIYGPIRYKGAPFAFRISIFELDVISDQAKSMLNTVAQAGSTAYPPASPILEILNGIGSTFYDGDGTDTEFRYAMVLDHKGGSKQLNHLKLEAGNYVLIRAEERDTFVPWEDIVLDENLGEVYWKNKKDSEGKPLPYTDSTYVVVEINKNISNVSVDLKENNFSGLISVLKEQDKQKATSLEKTRDVMMNVAIQRSQLINYGRAKEILIDLAKENSEVSAFEKRMEAKELFVMLSNSLDAEGKPLAIDSSKTSETYDLSEADIKYVLKKIRELVEAKIDTSNWTTFEPSNIYKAFKGIINPATNARTLDDAQQNAILDLVAPLKIKVVSAPQL